MSGGGAIFPIGIPHKLGTFPKECFDLWVNCGHGRSLGGGVAALRAGHVIVGWSLSKEIYFSHFVHKFV